MGRWKLLTGKHHMRGRGGNKTYYPGDIYVGKKEDIGWFINRWEQLDPDDPEPMPSTGPKLKSLGGGWFSVINPATGFPINDKKMRRAEAVALIADAIQAEKMRTTGAELEVEVDTSDMTDPATGTRIITQVDAMDAESFKKFTDKQSAEPLPSDQTIQPGIGRVIPNVEALPHLSTPEHTTPDTGHTTEPTTDGDDTGATTGAEGPATGGEPAAQETIPLDDPETLA